MLNEHHTRIRLFGYVLKRDYIGKSLRNGCPIKGFLAPSLQRGDQNCLLEGVVHNDGIPPPLKSVQNLDFAN